MAWRKCKRRTSVGASTALKAKVASQSPQTRCNDLRTTFVFFEFFFFAAAATAEAKTEKKCIVSNTGIRVKRRRWLPTANDRPVHIRYWRYALVIASPRSNTWLSIVCRKNCITASFAIYQWISVARFWQLVGGHFVIFGEGILAVIFVQNFYIIFLF